MNPNSEHTATEATTNSDTLRVAIQGVAGAFHDIAARQFFSEREVSIIPGQTFEELVDQVECGDADIGLMAIENTVAGSILRNYMLLLESKLQVVGEVYLRIRQNLMALPGRSINDLTEVYSHHMAIAQCQAFFKQHPHIRLIEAADTALSAKMIQDKKWQHAGAIASSLAADMYGLDLIAESIETNKKNYTRFLVLQSKSNAVIPPESNKVSLCFAVSHEVGSLHRVLSVMAAYELNLTKIQSAPIVGKQWEYFFFVDFVCDGTVNWQQGIEALRPLTADLRVLGVYQQGQHFEA